MFFNPKQLLRPVLNLTLVFFFSLAAFAEDKGAPPADAHGGGGAKKPAANTGAGGDKAWVTLQNQVLVLSTRRKQLQQNMAALKAQTHHHTNKAKDSKHIKAEVDQLVKIYKEYKEVTEEYNKLIVVLKYRYPERLAKDDARDYKPVEVESLEELEEKLDIEGRLSKVYKKAQSQYAPESAKEREPAAEKPNVPKGMESPGPRGNTIREQDPILLSQ